MATETLVNLVTVLSIAALAGMIIIALVALFINRTNTTKAFEWQVEYIKSVNANKQLLDIQEKVGEKIPEPVVKIAQLALSAWETLSPDEFDKLPQEWAKWLKSVTDGLPNNPEGGAG